MEGIPVRYKRATAPLDEAARERLWGSATTGRGSFSSEGSPELDHLVGSFYDDEEEEDNSRGGDERESERLSARVARRESLVAVLAETAADAVAGRILTVAELAVGDARRSSDGLKQHVMSRLRDKGFNAGLCESRWDKRRRLPAGSHEYIDVITGSGIRYIIEINLAEEFEIARPTTKYLELLKTLPEVFVGRLHTLNGVLKLMCMAAKESMKSIDLHLPPWRQRVYMEEKWFGSYKRTTNTMPKITDFKLDAREIPTRRISKSNGSVGRKLCKLELACREGPGDKNMAIRGM